MVRNSEIGLFVSVNTLIVPGYASKKCRISVKELTVYVLRVCIQKFPDWPPGVRTANGTALCH